MAKIKGNKIVEIFDCGCIMTTDLDKLTVTIDETACDQKTQVAWLRELDKWIDLIYRQSETINTSRN